MGRPRKWVVAQAEAELVARYGFFTEETGLWGAPFGPLGQRP
jgi:hypothetical protein